MLNTLLVWRLLMSDRLRRKSESDRVDEAISAALGGERRLVVVIGDRINTIITTERTK